jgi:AAA domain
MYAAPGTGKSLLALEIAAGLSAGRGALGNPPAAPVNVTYVDAENRGRDIRRRLRDMGYGPGDLGRLRFYSFPALEPLDTAAGGARLVRQAIADKAGLVVIDTTSRVIEGKENDSDTFIGLYRHTMEPLRKAGIAVLRLDHPGKDSSKGTRGSSAKQGDVDAEWELTNEGGGQYALRCRKDRSGQTGDEPVMLARRMEPLRHAAVSSVVSTKAGRISLDLSRLGATAQTSRRQAADMLRADGVQASNAVILEALRLVKSHAERDALIDFCDDGLPT